MEGIEGYQGVPASRSDESPRMESWKRNVAETLHRAARAVEEKTVRPGEEIGAISQFGQRTSRLLDRSAEFVSETDVAKARALVRGEIERHPGRSLLAAAAAGLLIGLILRRR